MVAEELKIDTADSTKAGTYPLVMHAYSDGYTGTVTFGFFEVTLIAPALPPAPPAVEETISSSSNCNDTNLFIDEEIISSTEITYTVGDSPHVEKLDMEKINSTASCPEVKLELINLEYLAPLDNQVFNFDNNKNEIRIETNDQNNQGEYILLLTARYDSPELRGNIASLNFTVNIKGDPLNEDVN